MRERRETPVGTGQAQDRDLARRLVVQGRMDRRRLGPQTEQCPIGFADTRDGGAPGFLVQNRARPRPVGGNGGAAGNDLTESGGDVHRNQPSSRATC